MSKLPSLDPSRMLIMERALLSLTSGILVLGLYIANQALTKLESLDSKVQAHETRITVLEKED